MTIHSLTIRINDKYDGEEGMTRDMYVWSTLETINSLKLVKVIGRFVERTVI